MTRPITTITYASPIGELTLRASDDALVGVSFPAGPGLTPGVRGALGSCKDVLALTCAQLDQYFAGSRTTFDLPLELDGTPFQVRVWEQLCTIPFGTTVSYQDLARRLGDVKATRAVGAANGQNPIPIIVPCHRVIGSNGALVGYGWGTDRKSWLLKLENVLLA